MPIEGLNNIYNVPVVKKDRESDLENRKKRKKREPAGDKNKDKKPGDSGTSGGKVDIRI